MKALPVSVILFMLLVFVIITNAIFVNNTANEINDLASRISDADDREIIINEINTIWGSRRPFLALSTSTDILDNVTYTVICLNKAYEHSNENDIQKYSAILSDQAHSLKRAETITIESVL